MSEKETTPTVYGEVEYETVECSSCGTKLMKKDAERFVIGTYHGKDSWSHKQYEELHFSDYATGWACEYCRDEPAKYPTHTLLPWFGRLDPFVQVLLLLATLVVILVTLSYIVEVIL